MGLAGGGRPQWAGGRPQQPGGELDGLESRAVPGELLEHGPRCLQLRDRDGKHVHVPLRHLPGHLREQQIAHPNPNPISTVCDIKYLDNSE